MRSERSSFARSSGLHHDLGRAPADAGQLLIRAEGRLHALYNSNPWRETDAPNAPRSGVAAGSAGSSWRCWWWSSSAPSAWPPPPFWVLTILPGSLPVGHPARDLRRERGHQGLRRQRRADHRVPRRAPYLRPPGPDPQDPARRDHRHRGRALLLPPRRRSHRHRARGLPELPPRTHRGGRQHHHPAARQGPLPHPRQEPGAQAQGGGARAGARAALLEGPHPRDVPEPDLFRPRRVRGRGRRAHLLRQVRLRAEPPGMHAPRRPAQGAHHLLPVRASGGGQAAARHRARPAWSTWARSPPRSPRRPPRSRSASSRPSAGAPPASTTSSTCNSSSRRSTARTSSSRAGSRSTPRSRPVMQVKAERALREGLRALESRRVAAAKDKHRAAARAAGGRAAHHRAADRLHQGDGGRLRLLQERVQPRGAGPATARLRLQGLRLPRRARVRADPGQRGRRLAGRVPPPAATASRGSPTTTIASSAGRSPTSRPWRSR